MSRSNKGPLHTGWDILPRGLKNAVKGVTVFAGLTVLVMSLVTSTRKQVSETMSGAGEDNNPPPAARSGGDIVSPITPTISEDRKKMQYTPNQVVDELKIKGYQVKNISQFPNPIPRDWAELTSPDDLDGRPPEDWEVVWAGDPIAFFFLVPIPKDKKE